MAYGEIRRMTPCNFQEGITEQEFTILAEAVAKTIKRIKKISIKGAIVTCTVESVHRISLWDFTVDFNNWGHITGTFWPVSENSDSSIPMLYGNKLSASINAVLEDKGIDLPDLSDYVDQYSDLPSMITSGLHINSTRNSFLRFKKHVPKQISMERSSLSMVGEHLYSILALLATAGFKNITCFPLERVGGNSREYLYEVAYVQISGKVEYDKGEVFDENAEVEIVYYDKRKIKIPYRIRTLLLQDFVSAKKELEALGFSNVVGRKLCDLRRKNSLQVGMVESIVVGKGKNETLVQTSTPYPYDTEIIIWYHTCR